MFYQIWTPHQFRTRKDVNKARRTRSKPDENGAKSTKLVASLPLITIWLQVQAASLDEHEMLLGVTAPETHPHRTQQSARL